MVRYATKLATMAVLTALLAAPAAAQEMAGKWEIEFEGPPGLLQIPIEFAQEGSVLTGSASMQGSDQRMTGTYQDGDLAFAIHLNFNGNEFTLSFQGEVDGDALTGSVAFPQGDNAPFTGKRL
jgi:hypothetical protein